MLKFTLPQFLINPEKGVTFPGVQYVQIRPTSASEIIDRLFWCWIYQWQQKHKYKQHHMKGMNDEPNTRYFTLENMRWYSLSTKQATKQFMVQKVKETGNKTDRVKGPERWVTSIIPVWTAETTRGRTGRRNADAAISNLGLSSLRALDRHWGKVLNSSVLCPSESMKRLGEKTEQVELTVNKENLITVPHWQINRNL